MSDSRPVGPLCSPWRIAGALAGILLLHGSTVRADVILTGMAIYEAVLEEFGFNELRASTRGLRFAAVLQAPLSVAA